MIIDDKIKAVYSINLAVRRSVLIRFIPTPPQNNLKKIIATFGMAKGIKTHRSMVYLCKEGYGQDAAQLGRNLIELTVTMAFIFNKDTNKRIKQYLSHYAIVMDKYSEEVKAAVAEGAKTFPNYPSQETIDEHLKEALTWERKGMGWSNISLKDMAKEVGVYFFYNPVYRSQSNLTHSNSSSFVDYLWGKDNYRTFDFLSSDKWVLEALVLALACYLILIEVCGGQLQIGMEKKLEEYKERYKKIVG